MTTSQPSSKLAALLEKLSAQKFEVDYLVRAPGRANIIGEHVDYCDGLVLPFAIEQSMYFIARKCATSNIKIISKDFQSEWIAGQEASAAWMKYFEQVLVAIDRRSLPTRGCDVYIASDIPIGAGVSSSSALCCGFLYLLNEMNGWQLGREELIALASEAEHGLGLKGGRMDQYSIFYGEEGKAILLDCKDHSYATVDIDATMFRFVLIDSGVQHSLVNSEYNSRRTEVERALSLVKEIDDAVHFRNLNTQHLAALSSHHLEQKRLRHIHTEIIRVEQAIEAIKQNDPAALGQLLIESHYSLRDDYEVSCAEIDWIVQQLESDTNVYGARMMGGGFGGSVICLVSEEGLQDFENLELAYKTSFGKHLNFHSIKCSRGVRTE